MHISIDRALIIYSDLPVNIRFPSYHPEYIVADAHRKSEIVPEFFVYTEGEHVYYHAFHTSAISGTDYIDIQSPYGYGGPLSTTDNKEFLMRAWQKYCSWCKEKNVVVEFIRFHPIIANQKYYNGKFCCDRKTVWIHLETKDLLSSYSVRARNAIRKAIKNRMTVEWWDPDEFLLIFPNLYRETMNSLNAEDFYFFNDGYFKDIVNLPKVRLAICKYNEEVVAGSIFLIDDYEIEYHLSAASVVGKKMAATNLILHEAALLGQELGCKVLHLGGGTDNKEDNSLLFFKSGFSSFRGAFHIGYHVHQPSVYQRMREKWQQKHGKVNSRILFYRY